jgi:hypothetical protein
LIARDGETVISKICHIEAASEEGPRWNPSMIDDERRHFDNLILLCDECHSIIDNKDNEEGYPVSLLKEWKKEHEATQTYSYLNAKPSLLSSVIGSIANLDFDSKNESLARKLAFKIDYKIKYNDLRRNRTLIEEYKVFYQKINTLYEELENQGSFKKQNLLRNVNALYLQVKGRYVGASTDAMLVVRENADNIFEDIQDALILKMEKEGGHVSEDIAFGTLVVIVDAFMRCKILEEPREE